MVTTRVLAKKTYASLGDAIPNIARFLINDLTGETGPGWTIVEARSNGAREIPSNPADMDSLVTATDWKNGTIATGDWIVLESANGNNTNHFQLYIEYQSSTTMYLLLIPLQDFSATGTGSASPPTFPTTAFGAGAGSFVSFTGYTTSANYSVVADEGMCMILADDGSNPYWVYIGELDGARTGGSPSDDRAYVISSVTSYVRHTLSAVWNRLSPVDDSTVLVWGYTNRVGTTIDPHDASTRDNLLGVDSILPVGVHFTDAGHWHFAGFLRNCYSAPRDAGSAATLDGRKFVMRNNAVGSDPAIVMTWDGITDYP